MIWLDDSTTCRESSLHQLSRLPERDPDDPARLSEAWVQAHATFHQALVGACPNKVKMRIRSSLYDQSERYRRLSVPARGDTNRDTLAEHRAIAEAVLARDLPNATALMADHLNKTTAILLQAPVALHSLNDVSEAERLSR